MEGQTELVETSACAKLSRLVVGKLKIGVDLLEAIRELVRKERIRTGVILSGIGALQKAVFRNAKIMPPDYRMEDKYRVFIEIDQPLELVSLPGWIATRENGEPEIHAHFTASTVLKDRVVTLGGHLTKGTITSIKCVIFIGVLDESQFRAANDPAINQMEIYF
jgi:predicted DNA-binding protein with PD1-like motif